MSNGDEKATLCCMLLLLFCYQTNAKRLSQDLTKDQTTSRANTLLDDADDIQRQLDNEFREKFGQNEIAIRLKRKQDNTLFKSFAQISNPHVTNSSCDVSKGKDNSKDDAGTTDDDSERHSIQEGDEGQCNEDVNDDGQSTKEETEKHDTDESEEESAEPEIKHHKAEWNYMGQLKWHEKFKSCGGHAQSPVILPVEGLIHTKGARKLVFSNYDVPATSLSVVNDGNRVRLFGKWPKDKWPLVYGGAAHSRRYLFHSLSVYCPCEHPIGGLVYPLETQLLHISAEYGSFDEAVKASSKDPIAFLGIVNIYKYKNCSHEGVMTILNAARKYRTDKLNIPPMPLASFCEPFTDHVSYYGSLTTPPCTEAVLWVIRRRSLPIARGIIDSMNEILGPPVTPFIHTGGIFTKMIRTPQPLNDRKIYLFT